MLPFVNSKSSLAKLAEWSPSDWPESLPEMRVILEIPSLLSQEFLQHSSFNFSVYTIFNLIL